MSEKTKTELSLRAENTAKGILMILLSTGLMLNAGKVMRTLAFPLIYLFARKFLEWGSKKKWKPLNNFCNFCLKKGEKAGDKLLKKAGNKGTYFALFLFVAIPIPGTGAWTGSLIASVLEMDKKKSFISILVGILMASIIMMLISFGILKTFI